MEVLRQSVQSTGSRTSGGEATRSKVRGEGYIKGCKRVEGITPSHARVMTHACSWRMQCAVDKT